MDAVSARLRGPATRASPGGSGGSVTERLPSHRSQRVHTPSKRASPPGRIAVKAAALCSTDGASRDDEPRTEGRLCGVARCRLRRALQRADPWRGAGRAGPARRDDRARRRRSRLRVPLLLRGRSHGAGARNACRAGNHEMVLLGPQGVRAREADHVDPAELAFLQALAVRGALGARRPPPASHPREPMGAPLRLPLSRFQAWEDAESLDADLVVVGHTHVPFVRRVGRTLVVNPGSIGQLRGADARYTYAVIDTDSLDAEIRAVPGNGLVLRGVRRHRAIHQRAASRLVHLDRPARPWAAGSRPARPRCAASRTCPGPVLQQRHQTRRDRRTGRQARRAG